jgi:streptogramin lyase
MVKKPDDMLARLTKTLADTKPTKAPDAVRQKCRKISVNPLTEIIVADTNNLPVRFTFDGNPTIREP